MTADDRPRAVRVPSTKTTVDMATGEETVEEIEWTVLAPDLPDGACPTCAVVHAPELFHDNRSLWYQYAFRAEHGRWPTWDDAMAHCTDLVKEKTREVLRQHGLIP